MFKRTNILAGLLIFSLPCLAQQEFDLSQLEVYRLQKSFLEEDANSRARETENNQAIVSGFYNTISLNALIADYKTNSQGLRSYLSDLRKFRRSPELSSCLAKQGVSISEVERSIKKANASLESLDAQMQAPIVANYNSRFSFGRSISGLNSLSSGSSLKSDLDDLNTDLSYLRDCCEASETACHRDLKAALDNTDYTPIKSPRADYPRPPAGMDGDEFAYFISEDPIMQNAISRARSTGDYMHINSAWSQVQTQCLKDKEYILSKEVKRRNSLNTFQDIAKAVQCTLPSILAHNGSYSAFQLSLGVAALPIQTKTHQFGCAPQMLQALADIRTTDHNTLTERYGTDNIVPQWVYQNPNEIEITRRSYAEKTENGWATSAGFLANVQGLISDSPSSGSRNPRAQNRNRSEVTNPFLSNVAVNPSRSPSSSRIAASRGNVARSRSGRRVSLARKVNIKDSQQFVRSARTLASKIGRGEDAHKNARLLAKGASNTKTFVKRVAGSLSGRGSSVVRQERRSLARRARNGVNKASRSRGLASGARTSARDTISFFKNLQQNRARSKNNNNNIPTNNNSSPRGNTVASTPTTTNNTGKGNFSDWDNPSQKAPKDPWSELRRTQAGLDSQITAKNNYIDNLVAEINKTAQQFGAAKRDLIGKYSPGIINTKIAGKTPDKTVSILSSIRKKSFTDLTQLGALNGKINELKGRLVAEEASLGNLFMLRGATGGSPVTAFNNPASFQQQGVNVPRPVGLPQVSPFSQNTNLQNIVPRTQPVLNNGSFSWNLLEFLIPSSWALPGLQERLASFDVWKKAVAQYGLDLEQFSKEQLVNQEEAKSELYESYREYYWLEEDPNQMVDLRSDLVAGIHHYNGTLKEEVDALLVKMRSGDNASSYDGELIATLEKAKNDATESEQALFQILKVYVESYPTALEDNPEMWWSQVSNLLLY